MPKTTLSSTSLFFLLLQILQDFQKQNPKAFMRRTLRFNEKDKKKLNREQETNSTDQRKPFFFFFWF